MIYKMQAYIKHALHVRPIHIIAIRDPLLFELLRVPRMTEPHPTPPLPKRHPLTRGRPTIL